jgi:methylmalonyl-CoA/ethylmalonyl-CoA epimerase
MPEFLLHHIGIVVASIENESRNWQASLAATVASQVYEDPVQAARVAFLELPNRSPGQYPYLELVEPLKDDSPVSGFLARGGGLHHLCFQVENLEDQIHAMKRVGAMLIRSPKPAVAFQGRRI